MALQCPQNLYHKTMHSKIDVVFYFKKIRGSDVVIYASYIMYTRGREGTEEAAKDGAR